MSSNNGEILTLDESFIDTNSGISINKNNNKKTRAANFMIIVILTVSSVAIMIGSIALYKKISAETDAQKSDQPAGQAVAPEYSTENRPLESKSITTLQEDIKAKQALEEEALANAAAKSGFMGSSEPSSPNQSDYATSQPNEVPPPKIRKLTGEAMITFGNPPEQFVAKSAQLIPASLQLDNDRSNNSLSNFGSSDNGAPENELARRLQSTRLKSGQAGKLPNLDYLLKKGVTIPCALKTGINTMLAGFVTCNVTKDVYSANGKTLLIARGSDVFGEQRSSLKHGQARVFLLWSRIDNPDGSYVDIDSPATDLMGYNGVSGYVDAHFAERFGGAIMISMIQDVAKYATTRASDSDANVKLENTSEGTSTMGQEVLRNTVNIPPHLEVLPATVVNIMVARDISFDDIYKVTQ